MIIYWCTIDQTYSFLPQERFQPENGQSHRVRLIHKALTSTDFIRTDFGEGEINGAIVFTSYDKNKFLEEWTSDMHLPTVRLIYFKDRKRRFLNNLDRFASITFVLNCAHLNSSDRYDITLTFWHTPDLFHLFSHGSHSSSELRLLRFDRSIVGGHRETYTSAALEILGPQGGSSHLWVRTRWILHGDRVEP